jgi:hypothetical protein
MFLELLFVFAGPDPATQIRIERAKQAELPGIDTSCQPASDRKESNDIGQRNKITMQFLCRTIIVGLSRA